MTCRCRTRYRFSHRAGGRYYWYGKSVDSRTEEISCSVTYFWEVAK